MSLSQRKRSLLKFSHYSTAVVLPKQLLELFGWQAGDQVEIAADHKNQTISIRRSQTALDAGITPQFVPRAKTPNFTGNPNQLLVQPSQDTIYPIPELD